MSNELIKDSITPLQKILIIVESPTKAKTISRILGSAYTVSATVGHIIDLPQERLGVDVKNGFKPQYRRIKGKSKLIEQIKQTADQSRLIILATDPDREGEAIAYHIYLQIDHQGKNIKRALFHEITKTAVNKALSEAGNIDYRKVEAQQARRILDRLVGYMVSPILWKTVAKGLSAGRVQSVALKLICQREDEIRLFKSEEYWTIDADLLTKYNEQFRARCVEYQGEKLKIGNQQETTEHLANLEKAQYILDDRKVSRSFRKPKPPFTTSTLQQEAGKHFRFSSKQTMAIAQQLYEGIELGDKGAAGLITYMRTDSIRSAPEALQKAREYIADFYGTDYLPQKMRIYQSKGRTQEAHEAIRPTDLNLPPNSIKQFLSKEQLKLYTLIFQRFIASQMTDAEIKQTVLTIKADDYRLKASESIPIFPGFLAVWKEIEEDSDENGAVKCTKLPSNLSLGEQLELKGLIPEQHFTEPPPRFSESSLVKTLDDLGIGRPSTYASIISVLFERKYVERKERCLYPTELGETVNGILIRNLPEIFSVDFTAKMENQLDDVEAGAMKWDQLIGEFYYPFEAALQTIKARKAEIRESVQEKTGEFCEKCGGEMVIRWGRNGKFMACSNFPKCRNTRPLETDEPIKSDKICPLCHGRLLVKNGKFGRFLGCENYPKCKHIEPLDIGIHCPRQDCGGMITEKRTKKGKHFYGCTKYPQCDFISWYQPMNESCPDCGNVYLEIHRRKNGAVKVCPHCKFEAVYNE